MAEPNDPADVNVNVKKAGGMTIWQAAGTLGIGSVLVLLIVPRMMSRDDKNQTFIQTELIGTLKSNSATQTEQTVALQQLSVAIGQQTAAISQQTLSQQQQAAAMNMFLPKVEESINATRELTSKLRPLTTKLDDVGTALLQKNEAERPEPPEQ